MTVTSAIRSLLIADVSLQGKIGDRVFPITSQQGTSLPLVLIEETGKTPAGSKNARSFLEEVNITISVHDPEMIKALEIAEEIRNLIDRFEGVSEGITIQFVNFLNQDSEFLEDKRIFVIEQDYSVWIKR